MREIKSFDIFDTLISRTVENPIDIFDIVEKQFPYNNFKNLRIQSQNQSNHTMDSIYNEFKNITNESDETINKLREFELITEMENTIPIFSNISKIKDGDIFVSDMYLSSNEIRKLLDYHNINKNTELFVSSGGKSDGTMWEALTQTYKINSHYGDNYHSDIMMASRYGIKGVYTEAYKFTVLESYLIRNNEFELCQQIRKFRLANPYDENTIEYKIYEQQISYNIPILLFICNKLDEILINENRNTVLFHSRDGCLLIKLFSYLYPQYKSIYLHSSRIINNDYTDDYISYLKENYDKDSCVLFDLHGSLNSGKKLFTSLFEHLPRIFIFDLSYIENYISEITYITNYSSKIEEFNHDYKGTLVQFIKNEDIRTPTEHPLKYIDIIHSIFDSFIKYFDVNLKKNPILNNNDFFKKYYVETVCKSETILKNQFEFLNLTKLANKYNSDKGNLFLCAHHYSIKYEQIFNDILNFKLGRKDFSTFDLLEIGLNISTTEESIPSLMIWNDYFNKNINITGFDIDNRFSKLNIDQNIDIKIGDQSSEKDLLQLKNKNYDMIIDDGYHASKHQQITFKTLWQNVKPGGYFIIEDLHYQPEPETCIKTKELFENWKSDNWIETEYINSDEIQIIKKDIESIEFYDSSSKNWGDSVKNAFVYIKKKERMNIINENTMNEIIQYEFPVPSQAEEKYYYTDKSAILNIRNILSKNGKYNYCEIGSYLGGSLVPFLRDPQCEYILSVDDRGNIQPDERGISYDYRHISTQTMLDTLSKHSLDLTKLETFDGSVHELNKNINKFDLVFIDGEHTDYACFRDFMYSQKYLKENSVVMFHDSTLVYKSLKIIQEYLTCNNIVHKFIKIPNSSVTFIFFGDYISLCTEFESEDVEIFYNKSEEEVLYHVIQNRVEGSFIIKNKTYTIGG